MPIRRSAIAVGVIGVVLVGCAALVRFVAVPVLTRLPGNLDVTLHYAGTSSLLNAKALQTGDLAHVFIKGAPTTIDRQIKVVSTTAHTAAVSDQMNLGVAGTTSAETHSYYLDRTTLETVPAPSGAAAEGSTGCLAIAFPLHPKADNSYKVYDASTQQCFPVTYVGQGSRGGRAVNEYTATITGPIKQASLLRTLPPALPKQTLAALSANLPESVRAQLAPALSQLPDLVPLSYSAHSALTVWADRTTGLPIDETLHQQVIVGLSIGATTVPVLPVLDVSAGVTPATVASTAKTAHSTSSKLFLLQTIVPGVLALAGLVLLVIAVVRRRPSQAPRPVQEVRPMTSVGNGPGA